MDPLGVYLSRIFIEFFLKPVYSTMVVEKFQSYTLKIIAMHLWVKKLNLFIFSHAPKQNSPPGFYFLQEDGNCPFLPNSIFWRYFSWGERGKMIVDLKELPKLTKGSVTSFDKFHHLCNLYFFGLCFVMQKFSFNHVDVWSFFNLTNKISIKKYDV